MADNNDARRLRLADDASRTEASRAAPRNAPGSPAFVGKTTTVTTYPTVAGRFYAIVPQGVSGTQTEGSAGSFSARSSIVYALNLGNAIPPSGTSVVCTFVSHRWVFRYDG